MFRQHCKEERDTRHVEPLTVLSELRDDAKLCARCRSPGRFAIRRYEGEWYGELISPDTPLKGHVYCELNGKLLACVAVAADSEYTNGEYIDFYADRADDSATVTVTVTEPTGSETVCPIYKFSSNTSRF